MFSGKKAPPKVDICSALCYFIGVLYVFVLKVLCFVHFCLTFCSCGFSIPQYFIGVKAFLFIFPRFYWNCMVAQTLAEKE